MKRTGTGIFLLLILPAITPSAVAQGTAFTYQGRLNDNGLPATGIYDLRFTAYAGLTAVNPVGGPLTLNAVGVSNGLFTVALDFGTGLFTGPQRWLEIAVRTNGGASFVALDPRQAVTPVPYATHAATASNVVSGSVVTSLNNLRDDVTLAAGANVTLTPSGNTLTIASTGGGGGETNSLWSLNGANAYYNAGSVGIGTSTPATRLTVAGAGAFNSPLAAAITLDNTPANRLWELHVLDDGRLQLADFTAGLTRMMLDLNGNVGIGTINPLSKLHVYDPADSVTHLIQSGGGINAWAKVAFTNLNGQWDIGSSRGFNNDVLYIDRLGNSSLEFQLSTTGLLGLGIEPQSKLHLYEPVNSVSQRIQTGGGVNAWTRLEFINGNGQWDIGTSRGFNGDELYFSRPGTGIALGLQPNGDAYLAGKVGIGTGTPAHKLHIVGEGASGYAIGIEGNATQNRDKGGWIKAMAYVNGDGTVIRSYNPFAATTVIRLGSGSYAVDFGFRTDDRFVSVTAKAGVLNAGANFFMGGESGLDVNSVLVSTFNADAGVALRDCPFMIIVY